MVNPMSTLALRDLVRRVRNLSEAGKDHEAIAFMVNLPLSVVRDMLAVSLGAQIVQK